MTENEIEKYIMEMGSDDLPTFGGTFEGGIHCQQIPDEITPCIKAIMDSKFKVESYLEIGVAAGGTTFLMNHFFKPGTIILIDDNKHHKAGHRSGILTGINYKELIGRSDDAAVINAAFELAPFDVIFIDGDHNYPGVKLDVVTYLPMLRRGGFLILHDSQLTEWGVFRVTAELKADASVTLVDEFVSKKHHRPLGVALFRKAV